MSVSLLINWPNSKSEEIPIASFSVAKEVWGSLGLELGLKWVPRFHRWIVVDPRNLDDLQKEMAIFREAVARKGPDWIPYLETVDRLIAAMWKLKCVTGWKASIG